MKIVGYDKSFFIILLTSLISTEQDNVLICSLKKIEIHREIENGSEISDDIKLYNKPVWWSTGAVTSAMSVWPTDWTTTDSLGTADAEQKCSGDEIRGESSR